MFMKVLNLADPLSICLLVILVISHIGCDAKFLVLIVPDPAQSLRKHVHAIHCDFSML